MDSSLLKKTMPFSVLRCDNPEAKRVFYLLHGLGDDHLAADRFGITDRLVELMDAGEIPPAHFVMPSGERGFWINWHDGTRPYEAHVIEEVLPRAEEILRLAPAGTHRHLMGVSMGGIGALQMGLRHPEVFASIASFSGPILDERQAVEHVKSSFARWFVDLSRIFGDLTDREFLESHNPFAITRGKAGGLDQRIFICAGSKEKPFFKETTIAFHEHLLELGIEHGFEIFEGGHGWKHWAPVFPRGINYCLEVTR